MEYIRKPLNLLALLDFSTHVAWRDRRAADWFQPLSGRPVARRTWVAQTVVKLLPHLAFEVWVYAREWGRHCTFLSSRCSIYVYYTPDTWIMGSVSEKLKISGFRKSWNKTFRVAAMLKVKLLLSGGVMWHACSGVKNPKRKVRSDVFCGAVISACVRWRLPRNSVGTGAR